MDKTFRTVTTIRGRLADSQPSQSEIRHVNALQGGLSAVARTTDKRSAD